MSRVRLIIDATYALERLRSDVDLAQVNRRDEILARVDPALEALTGAVKDLKEALLPDTRRVRQLQGAERAASLIAALEAGAKACGSGLYAADSLHNLVVDHAPAQDKIWWHCQLAGIVVGMLGMEPEIRRTLADRGVRVWEGKRTPLVPGDELWRVVHLDRFTADGDIYRWVTKPWGGGRCCRGCGMTENEHANELHRFDLQKRHDAPVINGIVAIGAGGGVLVHDECRAQWARWVAIASRYGSQAEAEAADAAAGRKPQGATPAPAALELEQPIARAPAREDFLGDDGA